MWSGEVYPALESCQVELEQATPLDDLTGNRILTARELREGYRLSVDEPLQNRQIRGGQQAKVDAVLLVYPFDILGEDQPDPRTQFCIGGGLSARPLATSLATD